MPLSIKDPETDRLARELAAATGESLTDTIRVALQERLDRTRQRRHGHLGAAVRRIQERLARLPVRDPRPSDALLGYDEHGLPH